MAQKIFVNIVNRKIANTNQYPLVSVSLSVYFNDLLPIYYFLHLTVLLITYVWIYHHIFALADWYCTKLPIYHTQTSLVFISRFSFEVVELTYTQETSIYYEGDYKDSDSKTSVYKITSIIIIQTRNNHTWNGVSFEGFNDQAMMDRWEYHDCTFEIQANLYKIGL